jgi:hypothetical protein
MEGAYGPGGWIENRIERPSMPKDEPMTTRAEFDPLRPVELFASEVTPAVRAATGGP